MVGLPLAGRMMRTPADAEVFVVAGATVVAVVVAAGVVAVVASGATPPVRPAPTDAAVIVGRAELDSSGVAVDAANAPAGRTVETAGDPSATSVPETTAAEVTPVVAVVAVVAPDTSTAPVLPATPPAPLLMAGD